MRGGQRTVTVRASTRTAAMSFAGRAGLLGGLWLLLTGGDFGNWYIGVLTVAAATVLSVFLTRNVADWRWTLGGTLRFVPFFLGQSLSGGLDVALRAMRPGLPLEPELLEYRLSIENHPARVFMVAVISLLPGTLGARLEGDRLSVHSLVGIDSARKGTEHLERRVSDLFGLKGMDSSA